MDMPQKPNPIYLTCVVFGGMASSVKFKVRKGNGTNETVCG